MPERAYVSSLEAIETFRSRLLVYREKAGRVLDEVMDDVLRTRMWLQDEQLTHWEGQIRRQQRELEMRQQELFSAKLSTLREVSHAQQQAVLEARRELRATTEKLEKVKRWIRQYDQRVEPMGRQVEKLRHNLVHDLGQAVAHLFEVTRTLKDYMDTGRSGPAAKGQPGFETGSEDPHTR
jgi:hypothetical protein